MAYDRLKKEQIYEIISDLPDNLKYKTITFNVDGSGTPITTGLKGYIISPYNAEILSWSIIGDTTGSCEIDVWKSNVIPTGGDSITGALKPSLTSSQINSDSVLTGWTTTINENDIIAFNVVSSSIVTKINLTIKIILL